MNNAAFTTLSPASFKMPVVGLKFPLAVILVLLSLCPAAQAKPDFFKEYDDVRRHHKVIEVDIVENPRKFSFDETPVFEDGLPAYGGEFITQGFIYPKGTLELGKGVDADGNPEFPELVIGTWFCRGWHVGDGAHTETGPVVITHQLFNFGAEAGAETIASDGLEIVDVGKEVKRAITGGTGPYRSAAGEQVQTLEGINLFPEENLVGVKLRVKLKVYP